MSTPEHETHSKTPALHYRSIPAARRLLVSYAWVIGKNLIGWLLILLSGPVGMAIPGPGGIPIFLIGFAMISFPGKRALTARVLHGKPVPSSSAMFRWGIAAIAIVLPIALVWYLWKKDLADVWSDERRTATIVFVCLSIPTIWIFGLRSRELLNRFIRLFPRIRRKVRPWLRKRGIDLLPPRRRRRPIEGSREVCRTPDPEILEIHERHYTRMRWLWDFSFPWIKRIVAIGITVAIFAYMMRPIRRDWPIVREQVLQTSPWVFLLASLMFTGFLAFRAISWRRILRGFGHTLPVAAAVRIWSVSELARYLPGAVWQMIGRIYLCKPYGVSGSVCSASQVLELAVFLLANVLVAVFCLVWYAGKMHPDARPWLIGAMALVPVLALLLHPKVFYGITNKVMTKAGKPPIVDRLSGASLTRLLIRTMAALMWQSAAVYLLVRGPVDIPPGHWWKVAGAYCLAWCAGFLAFWAPGGIGVRELVFMSAMRFVIKGDTPGVIAFLAVLLRLWTIVGELLLTGVAYLADSRGRPARVSDDCTTAPASVQLSAASSPHAARGPTP